MRLLNTATLEFGEFLESTRPPYAILSHTWEDEEVSLREMLDRPPSVTSKKGYRKIVEFCRIAAQQGFAWGWADTCCIDKTNHAELAESINSMFRWYEDATVCHVYLSDLSDEAELKDALPHCRWFTRGWTLQELLAPADVLFYDQAWVIRGMKESLIHTLQEITGILGQVLDGRMPLRSVSVGTRMSWAAGRETTRPEDIAYCLLGIFDINMPMIYGEGKKAFRRLQEEIIRQSNDMTIFAWDINHTSEMTSPAKVTKSWLPIAVRSSSPSPYAPVPHNKKVTPRHVPMETYGGPLLALSPQNFAMHSTRELQGLLSSERIGEDLNPDYAVTNKGLRIRTSLWLLPSLNNDGGGDNGCVYVLPVGNIEYYSASPRHVVAVILNKVGPNLYLRSTRPLQIVPLHTKATMDRTPSMDLYIATDQLDIQDRIWTFVQAAIRIGSTVVPIRFNVEGLSNAVDSCVPSHVVVQVEKAIPASHWDHTRQLFFYTPIDLVFAFSWTLGFDQNIISLICVINRKNSLPVIYLFDPSDHAELKRWFYRNRSASEECCWDDLHEQLSESPWSLFTPNLDVVVGGVSYLIMVDFSPGRPFTLLLSVERQGEGAGKRLVNSRLSYSDYSPGDQLELSSFVSISNG